VVVLPWGPMVRIYADIAPCVHHLLTKVNHAAQATTITCSLNPGCFHMCVGVDSKALSFPQIQLTHRLHLDPVL
jgi:hypothetical protein